MLRVTGDVVLVRRGLSRYLICWRPTGHRREIGSYAGGTKPPRLIRIAGEWVAYVAEFYSDGKYDIPVVCEPVQDVEVDRAARLSVAAEKVSSKPTSGSQGRPSFTRARKASRARVSVGSNSRQQQGVSA